MERDITEEILILLEKNKVGGSVYLYAVIRPHVSNT